MSAGPRNVSEKRSIFSRSSGRVVHPFTSTSSNSTGLGASARTRNFVFRCFENSSSDMLTGVILTPRLFVGVERTQFDFTTARAPLLQFERRQDNTGARRPLP